MILFGSPNSVTSLSSALGPLSTNLHSVVKNLGVLLDSSLNFNKQISNVVKGSFYQLRSIAKLKNLLSYNVLKTLIYFLLFGLL